MKRGGPWDDIAFTFRQKEHFGKKFECRHRYYLSHFVLNPRSRSCAGMVRGVPLIEKKMHLKNFTFCFFAVDVRFQQSLYPTGSHD